MHYQDQNISLDVANLVRSQNAEDALMHKLNCMGVDRDPNANIVLPPAVHAEIASLPDVITLQTECQKLIESVKKKYGSVRKAPQSDPLVKKRSDTERKHRAKKQFYRTQRQAELRRKYFVEKDDALIEAQLSKDWAIHTGHTMRKTESILVPERAQLAKLLESESSLSLSLSVWKLSKPWRACARGLSGG